MVTAYPWGRFADTYGRLPVVYLGECMSQWRQRGQAGRHSVTHSLNDSLTHPPTHHPSPGCFSVALFSILFGLSSSLEMALLTRLAMGLMNPLVGLVKTLVSEICGPGE